MNSIAVVGLGYVGLPLAVEFGKRWQTVGLDVSASKVDALQRFIDPSGEVASSDLRSAEHLRVTTDPSSLAQADFVIVAVPTPVDHANIPDFAPLIDATATVGKHMK